MRIRQAIVLFTLLPATASYASEGGAAVFKPRGGGRFTLAARIDPEEWKMLAAERR